MELVDDDWEVQNRRNKGRKEAGGSKPDIVKFFVSNIPQGCRPWDMENAFSIFGKIAGAFIAKKKDKEGKIFGFVSFKGVRDLDELKRNLTNVNLGGNKLVSNATGGRNSFGRKDKGIRIDRVQGENSKAKEFDSVKKGVSFLDILTSRSHAALDEEDLAIDPATFTLSDLVGRAATGRDLGFKELRLLRTSISLAGRWFSSFQPWIGQSLPYERLAWVSILGVPPHLLSPEVFNSIGKKYDKVAQQSQIQENNGDLSYDRLGILLDTGNKINGVLNLRWQDKRYKVWVVKENVQWISDFLDGGVESESVDQAPEAVNEMREKGTFAAHVRGGMSENEEVGDVLNNDHVEKSKGSNKETLAVNGPSLNDHWANLVSKASPRPRKRRRGEDLFSLEDQLGPNGLDLNNGLLNHEDRLVGPQDKDFNLNTSPENSTPMDGGNGDSGGFGEKTMDEGDVVQETSLGPFDVEVSDTVNFGKLIGINLEEASIRSVKL
ncbi:putative RNA recognition motif domain, nucleotide-binding alpha-beta plait domain superfamily [Helianthus anomalus]